MVQGRSTLQDPLTGRSIVVGQGLIPQIESFASKFCYNNKPTVALFNQMISSMVAKADKDTGNQYICVTNAKFWQDLQGTLGDYLANFRTDGSYMYSKEANKGEGGYVKVGATFSSYTWAGNTISFVVDRALTNWRPTQGYAVCIDLTADKSSNTPAVVKFTTLGSEYILNTITGVGGLNGKASGDVSTNVAGCQKVMLS